MSANPDTGRRGAVGVWHPRPNGTAMLRMDAEIVAADGALDRLVAAVLAVQGMSLPGVVPVADLIDDGGRIVLLTTVPVAPSLADLLGAVGEAGDATVATGPGIAGAVAAAHDLAQTLVALHRNGFAHGAIGLDTSVVTAAGTVLINETAIAAALSGRTATAAEDIRAWATVVRTLAQAWTTGADADRLTTAASVAERRGLDAALPLLLDPEAGPDETGPDRLMLAAAVSRTHTPVGLSAALPEPVPASPETTATAAATGGSQMTLLGRRAGARLPVRPSADAAATATGTATAADTDTARVAGDRSIRFGPGIPAEPSPGQAWPKTAAAPAGRRTKRRSAAGATLITLAIALAVAGWFLWRSGGPLSVARVSVAPAAPLGQSCDVTVDVVGTIYTDGRGGVVTYQWLRNDGDSSAVLHETIAPGTKDAQVHLHWSFSGRGSFPASVTLSVISPDPTTASTDFMYACP